MRRFLALVRSAALQALAEPLSAILILIALLTVHLAPVFHYHQFGEAGRLARECGFSALLVFGLTFATAAAVRAVGGELASGTAAAALARAVPRPLFFCAKVVGVACAFFLYWVGVAAALILAAYSSEIGAQLMRLEGVSHVWGPGVVTGVGGTTLGFVLAAVANRFWRARFCVSACLLMALSQPVALALSVLLKVPVECQPTWGVLPAHLLLALGCCVFIALAGALSVYFKPAPVTACVGAAVALSFLWPIRFLLPDLACFWLVDQLAAGGTVPALILLRGFGAGICLLAIWLTIGSVLMMRREIP